ncbi:MAG TPA: adenylyl-sulfate kinase [Thermoanaerobaculia bacterium]|nr:adenylyl-sulfate kinase [Thermoanaerobaculia bacterium]
MRAEPFIIWFIGVPAAGKTTIAAAVRDAVDARVEVLDSDEVRMRLTPTPDWSDVERQLFYRALNEIAQRLVKHGISVLIAASGGGVDLDAFRERSVSRTFFVHVDLDLSQAMKRRGGRLYRDASKGEIRLPLIRFRDEGPDGEDVAFCEEHGISAYELVLPRKVDLTLDGALPPKVNAAAVLALLDADQTAMAP